MKKFLIMLILFAVAIAGYFYLKPEEKLVEVVEAQVELQQVGGGMNFENPSVTQLRFAARIKGSVKNISDKELDNIRITYRLGNKEVSATLPTLSPGRTKNFITDKYETPNRTPNMKLLFIEYDLK